MAKKSTLKSAKSSNTATKQKSGSRTVIFNKKKTESDSSYVLKLVLYLMLGFQWMLVTHDGLWQVHIPFGAIVAVFFATHDHFKMDRKIEYAVILMAMLVGFWIRPALQIMV